MKHALIAVLLLASPAFAAARPPHADRIGVNLHRLNDGGRGKPFVDVARSLRPWAGVKGEKAAVPVDAKGWPTTDASTVLFDARPAFAWRTPMDDPDAFQPDCSGRYAFRLTGMADVRVLQDPRCTVGGQTYDPATNTTTGYFVVPQGVGLLIVAFTNTRRTPESPASSGFTDLRVIRPGYPADTTQTFTNEFLKALEPFAVIRYMNWLSSNDHPGPYGDRGHHALEWSGRRLLDDATQQAMGDKYGVAWEFIVELANTTEADLWINIPVAATDGYVRELAAMLKRDLKPALKLYIEHGNEVWNRISPQFDYNNQAAKAEVARGNSPLANDGSRDEKVWARRRHAARLVTIGRIFREVFGESGNEGRIRPVYASWLRNRGPYYADVLSWVQKTYGPPRDHFHALAGAAYFNAAKAPKTASVEQILDIMRTSSDEHLVYRQAIQRLAERYGLEHCQYEVGPDTGGGKTDNIANRIRANRHPRMKELILHDARDNWFARGGDLYMHYTVCSHYSRHGRYGLSEDLADLTTPKWQAIRELTGWAPSP